MASRDQGRLRRRNAKTSDATSEFRDLSPGRFWNKKSRLPVARSWTWTSRRCIPRGDCLPIRARARTVTALACSVQHHGSSLPDFISHCRTRPGRALPPRISNSTIQRWYAMAVETVD